MEKRSLSLPWQPVGRRGQLLLASFNLSGVGLEIGAANNPIIPAGVSDCRYSDYQSTEEQTARHLAANYPGANDLVEVDYIW